MAMRNFQGTWSFPNAYSYQILVIIWGHRGKLPTILVTGVVHAVHVKLDDRFWEVACRQAIANPPIANVEPT